MVGLIFKQVGFATAWYFGHDFKTRHSVTNKAINPFLPDDQSTK